MRLSRQRGFSLIELLVVITIIGILAAVGLTSYVTANRKARDSRRQADIQAIRSALEVYRSEQDEYPSSLDGAKLFFSNRQVPTDPQGQAYVYRQVGNGYELVYQPEIGVGTTYYNP